MSDVAVLANESGSFNVYAGVNLCALANMHPCPNHNGAMDGVGFAIGGADGPGIAARVRNVLLAGPDARIDCVLEDGGALEVRISHDNAKRLAPRDRISLTPHTVRVWR